MKKMLIVGILLSVFVSVTMPGTTGNTQQETLEQENNALRRLLQQRDDNLVMALHYIQMLKTDNALCEKQKVQCGIALETTEEKIRTTLEALNTQLTESIKTSAKKNKALKIDKN